MKINSVVKIVDFSSIIVTAIDDLNREKVRIKKGFFSINRANDSELFLDNSAKVVYDGYTSSLRTEYGENDFLIIYDKKYYFQFRNFVYDDNESAMYRCILQRKNDEIWIRIQIIPGKIIEHKMNLISDAKKLRCNLPIDSSKVSYNGVNLK